MVFVMLKVNVMSRKAGSFVQVTEDYARQLVDSNRAEYIKEKHIESPKRDKMIRRTKTK